MTVSVDPAGHAVPFAGEVIVEVGATTSGEDTAGVRSSRKLAG